MHDHSLTRCGGRLSKYATNFPVETSERNGEAEPGPHCILGKFENANGIGQYTPRDC